MELVIATHTAINTAISMAINMATSMVTTMVMDTDMARVSNSLNKSTVISDRLF